MAFCNLNWVNQGDSVREYKIEKGSLTEQHKPIINMDNIGKILNFSHNPFHFHLSNSFGFTAPKPPKWAFLLIETPCTFADIPNFHIRGSDDGFQHHLNLCSNKVKLHFIPSVQVMGTPKILVTLQTAIGWSS